MVLYMWQNGGGGNGGFGALDTAHCNQLQDQRKFPHMNTCRRWIEIHRTGGHVRPKIATGNKFSKREIHGQDLINLAFIGTSTPKPTLMRWGHVCTTETLQRLPIPCRKCTELKWDWGYGWRLGQVQQMRHIVRSTIHEWVHWVVGRDQDRTFILFHNG